MQIIRTVDGLAQLSSSPDPKPTECQALIKVVIFIGVFVSAIMSDRMVGFFTARGKCTFTYTLREEG